MSKKLLIVDDVAMLGEKSRATLQEAGFELAHIHDDGHDIEEKIIPEISDVEVAIVGGTNNITRRVIDAAPKLKLVVFFGIGFHRAIPDWEYAVSKGIGVANTPDGPTQSTAEWSLMAALMMMRGAFVIGRTGNEEISTMRGLEGQRIGIFALGRIGRRISKMLQPLHPASISYYSTNRHSEEESEFGLQFVDEDTLLSQSDIIFIAAPDTVGKEYFNDDRLSKIPDTSLVVSISRNSLFDYEAVGRMLERGVMMAQDDPVSELAEKFGPERWFTNNGHNGANTFSSLDDISAAATKAVLHFYETGEVLNDVSK